MASIFDSLPCQGAESLNPSWLDMKQLDDTNSTSQEYFQPERHNHFDITNIRLERDVLKRRINRAINRVTTAILKNQKNFRRLEKELIMIRRDVELARSINYKLYKMVSEKEMAQLDQIDDDLLSSMLDVEDAVDYYLVELKLDFGAVKDWLCCDTSLCMDKHKINTKSRSARICCLEHSDVDQSISEKASPLDSGTFTDTNSFGIVNSELDESGGSPTLDSIQIKHCIMHRCNTKYQNSIL